MQLQAPRIARAGAPLALTGTLSCGEAQGAGEQTVTLYRRLAGTPGFTALATASTEADGAFRFALSELEGNSVFYASVGAARSARTRVEAALAITLSAPAPAAATPPPDGSSLATSAATPAVGAVAFTGTVSPAGASTTVALQWQLGDDRWQDVAFGHVEEDGDYSILHSFSRRGRLTLRVLARSHGRFMTSASNPVVYSPSRRRSARVRGGQVTIQSSSDPLAYGSAVTIAGTVAGAADQPLTLFAQTAGGTFAPIATSVSEGGEYSFTQSPLQSTRYRVASASASSPILSETVAYAVTPTPSPTSAKAGEALTFTGTVAPAHEGQTVDLERQSLSGLHGWRVIASGTVSSSAGYSISYSFAAVGDALLRIGVPGDAEIEGGASEPFELEVTPAPLSSR